jgi:hypothetical protein
VTVGVMLTVAAIVAVWGSIALSVCAATGMDAEG